MSDNSNIIITLDTDWAPDFMIDFAARLLIKYNVKSTWFWTNRTGALSKLRNQRELFEIGIHPNFLPGSSHGDSVEQVLRHMTDLIPEAVSVRTHGVYQYGHLLSEIVRTTNIKVDATIFLPEMSDIKSVKHLTPYGPLLRIPTFWADDYELIKSSPCWSPCKLMRTKGLQVYNFHPIHIYLNTPNHEYYEEFRSNRVDLKNMSIQQADSYINKGIGVQNFFIELLQSCCNQGRLVKSFVSASSP